MQRIALSLALATAVTYVTPAAACDEHAKSAELTKLSVEQLAALKAEKKATPVDANNPDFRKKNGVVPGAIRLTAFNKFDAAAELPKDKTSQLVFYCANTQCKASEAAARRASEAGYTNVAVLPAGLLGWKSAGQPVEPVATPKS